MQRDAEAWEPGKFGIALEIVFGCFPSNQVSWTGKIKEQEPSWKKKLELQCPKTFSLIIFLQM